MIVSRLAIVLLCCTTLLPSQTQSASATSDATAVKTANVDPAIAAALKSAQQGKYDDALRQLQELSIKSPKLEGLAHAQGMVYYAKGDYLKAAEYFQQATIENPNDKETIQLLGLSYYRAGRPSDAIPYLEKVQSWYPRANVDASYVLGMSYIQAKDYPNARKAFAKMFDVPADSAASYLVTARMLFRMEFTPVAEEYAQKAIATDPNLPLANQLLGEIQMFQSKIPEAVKSFEAEIAVNPASPGNYYKLADAYSRAQKYEEAERMLQRSIWLDASSTGPYILLGKVLQKKGEPKLALGYLERAVTMDPSNPMTHQLLGQAYRDMGMTTDAERELKIAEGLRNKQTEAP